MSVCYATGSIDSDLCLRQIHELLSQSIERLGPRNGQSTRRCRLLLKSLQLAALARQDEKEQYLFLGSMRLASARQGDKERELRDDIQC
jgi:hypothetical protein